MSGRDLRHVSDYLLSLSYQAGRRARAAGMIIEVNPHPEGGPSWIQWREGWHSTVEQQPDTRDTYTTDELSHKYDHTPRGYVERESTEAK